MTLAGLFNMPPAFAGGFWKITAAQRHLMLTPVREVEPVKEEKPKVRRYAMDELRAMDARHNPPPAATEEMEDYVTSP